MHQQGKTKTTFYKSKSDVEKIYAKKLIEVRFTAQC